jgi:hypothetical protein
LKIFEESSLLLIKSVDKEGSFIVSQEISVDASMYLSSSVNCFVHPHAGMRKIKADKRARDKSFFMGGKL